MPTRDQINEAWFNDQATKYVEYKLSYFKTPTKKEPEHHWTYQWSRTYSLQDARKKAMYMINRGMVSPNSKTYAREHTEISYWVEVSKHIAGTDKERPVGLLIKSGDYFYWRGSTSGGYHRVLPNGTISSKTSDVGLPLTKTVRKRRQ